MATPTSTTIANVSLRYVGREKISDLDTDTNVRGVILQDLYESQLELLLRRGNWNFALKRAALVATTDPVFGWSDAYTLPTDFIKAISAHPHDDDDSRTPYKIEGGTGSATLVCNSSTIWLRYIFDVTDVGMMPPDFRDALAWLLAWKMALAGVESTRLAAELRKDYKSALAVAMSADGMEEDQDRLSVGSWITSRE